MFMEAGLIDQRTGTRDVTRLGGLAQAIPCTFWAALLAAISIGGCRRWFGFLKEEIYYALGFEDGWMGALHLVAIIATCADVPVASPSAPSRSRSRKSRRRSMRDEGPVFCAGPLFCGGRRGAALFFPPSTCAVFLADGECGRRKKSSRFDDQAHPPCGNGAAPSVDSACRHPDHRGRTGPATGSLERWQPIGWAPTGLRAPRSISGIIPAVGRPSRADAEIGRLETMESGLREIAAGLSVPLSSRSTPPSWPAIPALASNEWAIIAIRGHRAGRRHPGRRIG